MPLLGKNVLLVEDEALVAMLMEEFIFELGAGSVRMAPNVKIALELIDGAAPEFAVLDVNLGGGPSYPVARRLEDLAVPFLFVTGYGVSGMDDLWRTKVIVQKPASIDALIAGIRRVDAARMIL